MTTSRDKGTDFVSTSGSFPLILAQMYREGIGCEASMVSSCMWLKKASAQNAHAKQQFDAMYQDPVIKKEVDDFCSVMHAEAVVKPWLFDRRTFE